jgi:uncharacterized protein YqgV (UPF0045/DUF77 family)
MNHQVNLAIQVLPLGIRKDEAYSIVDHAIVAIQASGLHHVVCPFETVIEGPYSDVMKLVDSIQDACHKAGAGEILINMKLQRNFTEDVTISSKTEKYS